MINPQMTIDKLRKQLEIAVEALDKYKQIVWRETMEGPIWAAANALSKIFALDTAPAKPLKPRAREFWICRKGPGVEDFRVRIEKPEIYAFHVREVLEGDENEV